MANLPRLRVVNTSGVGYQTKIYIDDVDVSECFNDVTIRANLYDAVQVQLNATVVEIEVDNALQLTMPFEGTHDLLVKHGWTPPTKPVEVPVVRDLPDLEPLDEELFDYSGPMRGQELVDQFLTRVKREWTPNEGDTLSVSRVVDERGVPVLGKREYVLKVTMDRMSEIEPTVG